jgi:3-oxoacyl-[acyl-carrier protein] reductase
MPFLSRVVASRANALMQPGYPIDVAEALLFLASELSVGLHGQTLRVCGGNVVGE